MSGKQLEAFAMTRCDRTEVAPVEGHDDRSAQSLGECDDRRIGATEGKVGVLLDELGHSHEVVSARPFDVELGDAPQELALRAGAQAPADEVGRLSDYERGDDQTQVGA